MGLILLIIVLFLLIGAVPTWPHSRNWGYAPSGGVGLVLLVLVVLLLLIGASRLRASRRAVEKELPDLESTDGLGRPSDLKPEGEPADD